MKNKFKKVITLLLILLFINNIFTLNVYANDNIYLYSESKYVSHPIIFHGTVLENIRYGRPDASDEECIRAAEQIYADQFIKKLTGFSRKAAMKS